MDTEFVYQSFFENTEMQQEPQLQERNLNLSHSEKKSRIFSGKKSQEETKVVYLQRIERSPMQQGRSENERPDTPREQKMVFEHPRNEVEVENPPTERKLQFEDLEDVALRSPHHIVNQTPTPDSTPQKPEVTLENPIQNESGSREETEEPQISATEGEIGYIDVSLPGNKLFERLQRVLNAKAPKENVSSERNSQPTSAEKEASSNLMDVEVQAQHSNENPILPQEESRETTSSRPIQMKKPKTAKKSEKKKRKASLSPDHESDGSPATKTRSQKDDKLKRKKYSVAEDAKILKYVADIEDKSECVSKNFWERAVTLDNLLGGTRTAESLRSRYRFFLSDLTEEEIGRIHAWNDVYGSPGYIVFQKKLVIDPETKKQIYRNQFESIEFEELSKTLKEIPISTSDRWRPTQWRGFSSENQLNENLSFEQKPHKKPLQNVTQRLNIEEQPRYQNEDSYLGDNTRKIVKKDNVRSDGFASKVGWLMEIAEKHQLTPPTVMEMYYYCSMNPKVLELYLSGEKSVLWTKEEDKLLSEGGESAIRVLSKIRDPSDVRARSQFLSQYAHVKLLFGR